MLSISVIIQIFHLFCGGSSSFSSLSKHLAISLVLIMFPFILQFNPLIDS